MSCLKGETQYISSKVFGCNILNNGKDNLGKFDSKADESIFLGYSLHGHTYRVGSISISIDCIGFFFLHFNRVFVCRAVIQCFTVSL